MQQEHVQTDVTSTTSSGNGDQDPELGSSAVGGAKRGFPEERLEESTRKWYEQHDPYLG